MQREVAVTKGLIHGKRSVVLLDISGTFPKVATYLDSELVTVVYGFAAQVTYPSSGSAGPDLD